MFECGALRSVFAHVLSRLIWVLGEYTSNREGERTYVTLKGEGSENYVGQDVWKAEHLKHQWARLDAQARLERRARKRTKHEGRRPLQHTNWVSGNVILA